MVPAGVVGGFAGARAFDGLVAFGLVMAALMAIWALVSWIRGGRGWRIDAEIVVAAPPELVFAILDDPALASELDPRIVSAEVVAPGRQRYRLRVARRDVEMQLVETERDPPTRLVDEVVEMRVGGKLVEAGTQRQAWTLAPVGDGTRVRVEIRGRAAGAARRFALGVSHPGEAQNTRATLRRLRDYASAPARSP